MFFSLNRLEVILPVKRSQNSCVNVSKSFFSVSSFSADDDADVFSCRVVNPNWFAANSFLRKPGKLFTDRLDNDRDDDVINIPDRYRTKGRLIRDSIVRRYVLSNKISNVLY